MVEPIWERNFTKCPHCSSEERYFEGIINDHVAKNLLPENVKYFDFQRKQGIGIPQEKLVVLPIGAEIQGFDKIEDVCCECGAVYAVHLGKPMAKKSLAPVQLVTNREQRRAGLVNGQGFPFNNSLLS